MGENSKIEWTDHTFNPWWGCTHVHEGCRHCYAEEWARRFGVKWGPAGVRRVASEAQWKEPLKWNRAAEKAGVRAKVFCASMADVFEDWSGPMIDSDGNWWHQCDSCKNPDDSLLREAIKPYDISRKYYEHACGEHFRRLEMDDVRKDLFALIDATPHLDWLLLTKRPENIRRMWPAYQNDGNGTRNYSPKVDGVMYGGLHMPNVWLGTSISDQASADKQIPELLKCRDLSPVLFLSIEPLLGPVDLRRVGRTLRGNDHDVLYGWTGRYQYKARNDSECSVGSSWANNAPRIDWVIVGGESGHGARPMHPQWVRDIRDQCQAAGVPFFFKQWGRFKPSEQSVRSEDGPIRSAAFHSDGTKAPSDVPLNRIPGVFCMWDCGANKSRAGRTLDGREWSEFPSVEVTH